MKYSCNACGMYVEAGSGHDCYGPLPDNALKALKSVSDEWQRRAEQAEAALAAERIENARLRRDDQNVMAELDRTLKALAGTDDLSTAMHMLGPDEHLSDLAIRVKADLAALRTSYAKTIHEAFREGWLERGLLPDAGICPSGSCERAWQPSEARRGLAEKGGET